MRNHKSHGSGMIAIVASAALLAVSPIGLADDHTKRTAGETVDDTTINSTVKTRLAENESVKARDINVETNKGRVALIGVVQSQEQRASALATAEKVSGVTEVVDALIVVEDKRSVGRTVDDQTIETKLKVGLTDAGTSQALAIITEVRNGEVLLGGFVESAEIKKRAGEIAAAVDGVTKVHNRIAVK